MSYVKKLGKTLDENNLVVIANADILSLDILFSAAAPSRIVDAARQQQHVERNEMSGAAAPAAAAVGESLMLGA